MGRDALTFRLALPVSAEQAFAWHELPGAFERLSPPWQRVRVLERTGGIRDGGRVTLDLGFPVGRWSLEHHGYAAGREFHDRQRTGPFASYAHAHRFLAEGAGCVLEDEIAWRLPFAPLSAPGDAFVQREFARVFAWRHRVTLQDLERRAARPGPALSVAVTGASGFLGGELCAYLSTQGHRVLRFVRGRDAGAHEIAWDPARGGLDPAALTGLDAVVHLSGAGIAEQPWTAARKRELIDSRVRATELLAKALARADSGPRVLLSASAIGWYGDRGEEALSESSVPGRGFLAELAQRWEAAAEPARVAGVRVVHPRIGIVLWPGAGALAKLAAPYFFGAGGPLGSGQAWWSWITLHDLLDSFTFALEHDTLVGAYNAVAPQAVRQVDAARALGHALGRPSLLPAPACALRALLGREMADDMLLASQRVAPAALLAAGFTFRDPEIGPALERLYGARRATPSAGG